MKARELASFAFFVAIVVLTASLNGVLPTIIFLLALFIHEGFHLIAASFLGIPLKLPTVGALGLRFDIRDIKVRGARGALLYLSGSLGNLLFALIIALISRKVYVGYAGLFVFFNVFFASVNLIPAYPMDMARALCCLVEKKLGALRAVKIVCFISELSAYLLFLLGAYLFLFKSDNAVFMLLSVLIFYYSAKERKEAENLFVKKMTARYRNAVK